jgi:hypothetical protein
LGNPINRLTDRYHETNVQDMNDLTYLAAKGPQTFPRQAGEYMVGGEWYCLGCLKPKPFSAGAWSLGRCPACAAKWRRDRVPFEVATRNTKWKRIKLLMVRPTGKAPVKKLRPSQRRQKEAEQAEAVRAHRQMLSDAAKKGAAGRRENEIKTLVGASTDNNINRTEPATTSVAQQEVRKLANQMETVTSKERPYDYRLVYDRVRIGSGRESMSDKDVGKRLGVSERQIRRARMEGMDWPMADLFCIRAGVMPHELFGWDAWLTEDAYFAGDVKDKLIKPEDVHALFEMGAHLEEVDA